MWKLDVTARLERWRQFRAEIGSMDLGTALELVQDRWNTAPFTPFYLDVEDPKSWPDPWTLIAENYYCDLARALGMLYTIHLSDHGQDHELVLCIMDRPGTFYRYNLVVVDGGKYVLNLDSHGIVNIRSLPPDLRVIAEYSSEQLKLEQY
jgi:hypothetical protein